MSPKSPEFNRRDFLKLAGVGIASALGLGAYLSTRERATVANTETSKSFFPESLAPTLEYWMFKQDYDHKFLEPLEEYAKNLYETSPDKGWIEVENNPALKVWVGESDSPELLQKSHAVFFKVNGELRGFLWNDDGTYSLQGEGEDRVEGTLSHFSGEVEGNYEGSFENQIPIDPHAPFQFIIEWRGPNKFQGGAFFRGHYRPLSGGKDQDSFPLRPMLPELREE